MEHLCSIGGEHADPYAYQSARERYQHRLYEELL